MKGRGLALASMLLVTAAQLMLRWSVVQLPLTSAEWRTLPPLPLSVLAGGLFAYGLSMLCWTAALRHLALNRAYPLLSISYLLVWALALWLPGFHEPFHAGAVPGVLLTLVGLLLLWQRAEPR
jgi:undecaprenyl phosphate-alpha-L-ara4N flippase subunit ArnF